MKKLLLLFTLIIFLLQQGKPQTNINLSKSPTFDGECYLAVNPKNPKHLVTAWMHVLTGRDIIATRSSFDGGVTWTATTFLPHLYGNFGSADPSIAFGKDSCVYLAYIDFSGLNVSDSGFDMVARSVNGGISWAPAVKAIRWNEVPNFPCDRPWIAADGTNGPYSGRVYLTSMNAYFTPPPHHPWFTFSTDSGLTWKPIKRLDSVIPAGKINEPAAFVTVSTNGTFYACYPSYDTTLSPYARAILVKTYNGGSTFTPYVITDFLAADIVPKVDSFLNLGYCLVSNPNDTSNIVLLGTTNHFGDPDIACYYSTNAGQTWSGPVRVNDDPTANGIQQDMVWAGFSNGGILGATWRDRRNGGLTDTAKFDIYGTVSRDGGQHFSKNLKISDSISPPVKLVRGNDFQGVAVTDSNLYTDWCRINGTLNGEIYFNSTLFSNSVFFVPTITESPGIKVEVYPNPFHDETTMVIHSVQPLLQARLVIYSIDGKQVSDLPVNVNVPVKLKLGSLAAGTYVWSLMQNANKLAEGKWLVQ